MKKIFTIASVTALGALAGMALEWDTTTPNLASGAEVTVSSKPGDAHLITDNNNGNRWQAVAKANEVAPDWVLLDLGEAKELNLFEIRWEASHPSVYSVYVSEEAIPYGVCPDNEEYNVIDSQWLADATAAARREMEGESNFTDEFVIENTATARYVLVYCNEYNNNARNYGSSIYEIRLGLVKDVAAPASLSLDMTDVIEQESTTATVKVFSSLGDQLDLSSVSDLTLTCSTPEAVEIAGGEDGVFTVKGLLPGAYTLTASAKAEEQALSASASFNVLYDWSKETNIATGKPTTGRLQDPESEYEFAPSCATDGNEETYYTFDGGWGGGDSWIVVDLGSEHIVKAVGVSYGKNSGGRYAVSFGGSESQQPESNTNWNNNNAVEGWENSETLSRVTESVNTYVPALPVRARFVAIRDKDNPNGKPEVREIYIAGEEAAVSVPTEISLSVEAPGAIVTNDKITLSASVFDQYGAPMNDIDVEYFADGTKLVANEFVPTSTGTYSLEARCGEISASEEIEVAIDGTKKLTPASTATRNGEACNSPMEKELGWSNEELGQTVEITLDKVHNFSLLRVRWEAACASDYTIEVTDKDGNSTTALAVSGRKFVAGTHPVDHIVHAATAAGAPRRAAGQTSSVSLENVKKLSITPTAKSHGYSLRLLGIDAYGEEVPDEQTGIVEDIAADTNATVDVYNMQGIIVRRGVEISAALEGLPSGIYIVGGKKMRK